MSFKIKKTKTPKKSSKFIVWAIIAIALLIGVFFAWKYFFYDNDSKAPHSDAQGNQKITVEVAKKHEEATEVKNDNSKTPVQNEGANPNTVKDITGNINSKFFDSDSQRLVIRVTLDQFINPTGTCTLTLTNASRTVTKTAPTINNPSSSTCQGFDIPSVDLGSGTWRMSLQVNTNEKTGTIDGGEVNIP